MTPKSEWIAAILDLSPSASPAFLAEFSRRELRDYFVRLRNAREAPGVRLGIDAPRQYAIVREEFQERIERSAAKQHES